MATAGPVAFGARYDAIPHFVHWASTTAILAHIAIAQRGKGERRFSLKIVHLCSYAVFSGPLPGALGLAHAQAEAGHDVWFAFDRFRGAFSPYEEAMRESAHPLPGHGAPPVALALAPKGGPWRFWRDWRALRAWLYAAGIDVVHAHLTHDHWLARLACPPGVCLVRTLHSERASQARLGSRTLFARTDRLIARCTSVAAPLTKRFGVRARPQVYALAGGLPLNFWRPSVPAMRPLARAARRAAFGLPVEGLLLLHVGLMAGRGQQELLFAAQDARLLEKSQPAVHIAFVGLGPEKEALEKRAAASAAPERLHFVGYLAAESLRSLYEAADGAFVAQAGSDAAVRAALEAMAMGLPVLAPIRSGVTAATSELDEQTGYLAASRAPDALAEALIGWRDDPARSSKGQRGQRRVRQTRSFAQEARETLKIYEQSLAIRSEPG